MKENQNCKNVNWLAGWTKCLVNLLNGWATGATGSRRGTSEVRHTAARHAATISSGSLVNLHHDRVHHTLKLLLLGFELVLLCQLVLVQPVEGVLDGLFDGLLVATLELVLQLLLLQGVAHGEAVVLQAVLRLNLALVG